MQALDRDPDETFVTNALFVRSRYAAGIAHEEAAIFAACWPVHEWFLSIVKPRLILCFGYQRKPNVWLPFRRIVRSAELVPPEEDGQHFGVLADGELQVAGGPKRRIALAAVYHPSARNGARWTEKRL
jgi:hypothetical protein